MQTSIKLGAFAFSWLLTLPHAVYAAEQTGSILLLDPNNAQCVIPVPGEGTGKRAQNEFSHNDGTSECKDFAARQIAFDGLTSAVQILITSDRNCNIEPAPDRWWMELRTTRRFTSTDWYELEDLASRPVGKIITPGLLMHSKNVDPASAARDSTSCVRVIAARAPGSAPMDKTTATLNNSFIYENNNPDGEFTCGTDQIIIYRAHRGDETKPRTDYICATFKHGSTELNVKNDAWTDWFPENKGEWFTCPQDTVMTGREHKGDETGDTRYRCGQLMKGTQQMSIHKSTEWSDALDEHNHGFLCKIGTFMVGRWHEGDEKDDTRYRCATAWMQGAEKP